MRRVLVSVCGALAISGCTGFELARLAPPGIIRYERIADKKEPNPAIVDRIEQRGEGERPKFPKLGETTAGGATLTPIPDGGVAGEISQLASDRDHLDMALETDKLEAGAAAEDADAINEAAADLSVAVEKAKAAAARDRAQASALETENEK